MSASQIHLIAAVARNGIIGAHGGLPWHIPGDLKRFKALTMDKALIFGRTTWDAMNRELPGRHVIVLSTGAGYAPAHGARAAQNPDEALSLASRLAPGEPVMVGGGAKIYELFFPRATHLVLTHVETEADGDTSFPPYDPRGWKVDTEERHDDAEPAYAYVTYSRA